MPILGMDLGGLTTDEPEGITVGTTGAQELHPAPARATLTLRMQMSNRDLLAAQIPILALRHLVLPPSGRLASHMNNIWQALASCFRTIESSRRHLLAPPTWRR
jgi:hypothetical protein